MKYSTAAKHPEGLSEKEIRAQRLLEKPAGRKYKKQRRRQLASADIERILLACDKGIQTQAEVARHFRVTSHLVSRLVVESEKQPEKLRELKQREKDNQRAQNVVEHVATTLLERSIPIEKAAMVQK